MMDSGKRSNRCVWPPKVSRNEFVAFGPIRPINGRKRPFSDCLCIRPTKSVWNKGEKPSKSSQKLEEIIPKVLRNGREKKCQEMSLGHLRPIRPINGRKRPFSDCLCIRPTKSVWNKGEKPSKSSQKLEEIIPKVLRNGRKKKGQEMGGKKSVKKWEEKKVSRNGRTRINSCVCSALSSGASTQVRGLNNAATFW